MYEKEILLDKWDFLVYYKIITPQGGVVFNLQIDIINVINQCKNVNYVYGKGE